MICSRVLIVCRDQHFGRSTTQQLAAREEFAPVPATSTTEAVMLVFSRMIDIVLLVYGETGDIDVQSSIELLRQRGYAGPIIVINAADSVSEEVLFFGCGANDVVNRREAFPVLYARIRAHLRQHADSPKVVVRIGPFVFRPEINILIKPDGSRTKLTAKESLLLHRLYQANGAVVARETLVRELWGEGSDSLMHTLQTHVYRLRRKLDHDARNAFILTTKAGYQLLRFGSKSHCTGRIADGIG